MGSVRLMVKFTSRAYVISRNGYRVVLDSFGQSTETSKLSQYFISMSCTRITLYQAMKTVKQCAIFAVVFIAARLTIVLQLQQVETAVSRWSFKLIHLRVCFG